MSGTNTGLQGRVCLVTGAAGGMGRAITLALSNAGALVVATDIAADRLDAVVAEAGGATLGLAGNIADAEHVSAAVALAVSSFGRLDAAVNAAAIEFEQAAIAECDDADFDRMMNVNVRSVFLCMKHEIRAMLANPAPDLDLGEADTGDANPRSAGSIVNIASTNSFKPQMNQPAYTASKHAVLGLTRACAVDYAAHRIRVNAICPGAVDTPMLRNAIERRHRDPVETARRLSPLGRFGEPAEIAAAALWLCSDASSFTTGHALAVDGGMLAT